MPRRLFLFAVTLILAAVSLWAESPGERELALGREALAKREYGNAAEHLTAATAALDPQGQREMLAEAWLQLGMADLAGLDRAEEALAAFRKSAELAANPSSAWLWASTAAEKLGRAEEAAEYKARALAPPAPPAPAPAPAPAAPQKPDAFQHFFGPKEKEPAAAQPTPPPQAAPAEPLKKGDAFQHMFGEASPERPAGARAAQEKDKDRKEIKDNKDAENKDEKARVAKGEAFRHFFGEKKVEKKPEEESAPPPR
jgi:tetratricopeptide (TPR) repeat protein